MTCISAHIVFLSPDQQDCSYGYYKVLDTFEDTVSKTIIVLVLFRSKFLFIGTLPAGKEALNDS